MGYKNEKQMGCITRVGKPDGLSEIDCGYRIAPLRQKDKTFCKIVIKIHTLKFGLHLEFI